MLLIGLTGKKKSGKSTCADYLQIRHEFKTFEFASALKEVVKYVYNLSDEQVHDTVLKETVDPRYNVTPRELLQVVGTDCFRDTVKGKLPNISINSIWIHRTETEILKYKDVQNIVVTDVRFPDEAELIKKHGGIIINISRTVAEDQNYTNHASETQNIQSDYTIQNDGNMEDLKQSIVNLLVMKRTAV
jgi:hypothetical protein